MYKKMKKPKIGSRRYVASGDGYDFYDEILAVRKGSKPFRGFFPYYFTTTRTIRVKRGKK